MNTSDCKQSGTAPDMNPASRRAEFNKRLSINSWQYFGDDGEWHDGEIKVTCQNGVNFD